MIADCYGGVRRIILIDVDVLMKHYVLVKV